MVIEVPFKKQEQGNTCGAACLEMVLRYYGIDACEKVIAQDTFTRGPSGRYYIRIAHLVHYVLLLNRFNALFSCFRDEKDIYRFIDMNIPVIVLQRSTVDNERYAHYRVVKGYENNVLIVNDPEKRPDIKITEKDFFLMWKKQPNGECLHDNLFILIYPKEIEVNHLQFSYDPLLFRRCANINCSDPLQKNEKHTFKCYSCGEVFKVDYEGLPFGCSNQNCRGKYWVNYTCGCGFTREI